MSRRQPCTDCTVFIVGATKYARYARRYLHFAADFVLILFLLSSSNAHALEERFPKQDDAKSIEGGGNSFCRKLGYLKALKLSDVLRIALCESATLARNAAIVGEMRGNLMKVNSTYYPAITLEASDNRVSKTIEYPDSYFQKNNSLGRSRSISLSLNWILYDGGQRAANLAVSDSLIRAALADREHVAQDVILKAATAFFRAQAATAAARAARDLVRNAEDSVTAADALLRLGSGVITDKLLAQGARDQAILRRIEAESERTLALIELAGLLGGVVPQDVSVASDQSGVAIVQYEGNIRASIDEAVDLSPHVQSLREELRAAEFRLVAAKAEGAPIVSLGSSFYRNGAPDVQSGLTQMARGWSVGVQIKIPLFAGFRRNAVVSIARSQRDVKRMELLEAEKKVSTELWTTQELLRRETEKMSITGRMLERSRRGFLAARARYNGGVGSILELLKSQSDVAEAERQFITTSREWQIEKIRFAVRIGTFGGSLKYSNY